MTYSDILHPRFKVAISELWMEQLKPCNQPFQIISCIYIYIYLYACIIIHRPCWYRICLCTYARLQDGDPANHSGREYEPTYVALEISHPGRRPLVIWAVFKTSIKTEWKLFILARNPCAILARPQWELARGQFFKRSLRDLARRWIPAIECVFACAMQARSCFRTWVSWLLRFSARSVVSQLLDFLACPVASRLLGSNQRSSSFASSVVPECLQWVYSLKPGCNQYSGMAPMRAVVGFA